MRLWKWIRREWEQAACCGVALLLLGYVSVWVLGFGGAVGEPTRRRPPEYESILGETAFAFLDDPPVAELGGNPFEFSIESPAARVRKKPAPVPKPAPRPAPRPKRRPVRPRPAAKPEPKPEPKPAPARVVPAKRYGMWNVKYLFSSTNRSGKRVAVLQFTDPRTKRRTPCTLGAGDAMSGLRVVGFDGEVLVMADARGKRHGIRLGRSKTMTGTK